MTGRGRPDASPAAPPMAQPGIGAGNATVAPLPASSRPLLLLRPEPGAAATAARAAELGLEALCYPLFAVEPLDWTAPQPADFDALMLTSANAPRMGGPGLARYGATLPVWCVGEATARAAREAGLTVARVVGPDAAALAAALARAGHRRVLHPGGVEVRPLAEPGLEIRRVAVYRAAEAGDAAGLAPLLARGPLALVHSPRAAARLAALVPPERRGDLALVAISASAARAAGTGWQALLVASSPDDRAMLALARQICQIPPSSR